MTAREIKDEVAWMRPRSSPDEILRDEARALLRDQAYDKPEALSVVVRALKVAAR